MPVRTAEAVWNGGLKDGKGTLKTQSGAIQGSYSFLTRFESAPGTNPEELLAAAHAGCFSMALSAGLGRAGFSPERVQTTAKVHLEKGDAGFSITRVELVTEAKVPNITPEVFQTEAAKAKEGCPVSKLFKGAEIKLEAKLV